MSDNSIVQCTCGSRVRIPQNRSGRSFRCPKCSEPIVLTASDQVLTCRTLPPGNEGAKCPICQTEIGSNEMVLTCPTCDQQHHRECWTEVGGCATYGCKEAPDNEKQDAANQPLTAWGDTKTCPACHETIKSIALRCRYCGTDFKTVDPLSIQDLRRHEELDEKLRRTKVAIVVNTILSFVGVLAPITLVAGLIIVLPNRARLSRSGPIFQVLGWASIGLSALYSVLMLFFVLQEA